MKRLSRLNCLLLCGFFALTALYSCQKANVKSTDTEDAKLDIAISAAQAIQITNAGASLAGSSTDAIYAVNAYPAGGKKDSVTFASLPAAIGVYLTANYAGYTVQKTFKVSTAAGVLDGYVVVILFNAKPVALRFDATGTFVSVLKQCERHDMGGGPGWHEGGRFGDRDGKHRDTVALSALPTAVKAYFTANYATDTLLHAALNMDGSYSVISANKALYVTTVSATGTLLSRIQISPRPDSRTAVTESALLSAITTYLTTTFPGYVFDKAFVEKAGTTVIGYDVFITVNGTRHALLFDATGKFFKSICIR
ncbi:MAG: PepSY-like domain-containing protein [Mucilaginibacter sp.]|uniref:PepSY-like domain-containing protein n=1 Tax=Mucilaginibacter sp. TaxID=1882438 RepID=UPI00326766AE